MEVLATNILLGFILDKCFYPININCDNLAKDMLTLLLTTLKRVELMSNGYPLKLTLLIYSPRPLNRNS